MKFLVALVCLSLTAVVLAQDEPVVFDWREHGFDWINPGLPFDNECSGSQQSPIDITLSNARLTNVPGIRQMGARTEDRSITFLPIDDGASSGVARRTISNVSARQDAADMTMVTVNAAEFDDIQMIGGTVFEPWTMTEFVFHAPSEHTFAGLQFPLEVQYFFDSGFGQMAAVSYMFRIQGFSATFIRNLAQAIRDDSPTASLTGALPITRGNFFHYRGSETIPPCHERVDWHVFQTAIPISQDDLDVMTEAMTAFNFRETQPLNGRVIGLSDGCGLGRNHFAFNSNGRSCGSNGHHLRSVNSWENTPYANDLHTQESIVQAMLTHPELKATGEVFADILDYNKRAVLMDSTIQGNYQYTRTFPEIKNRELKAHADDLAGAFARATYSMEGIDYDMAPVDIDQVANQNTPNHGSNSSIIF